MSQRKLQAGADANVVFVIVNYYLRRSMFRGHQQRRYLHVVPEVGSFNGVPQTHLDGRRLHVGTVSGGPKQYAGRWMVSQILPHSRQLMRNRNAYFSQMVCRTHSR